LPFDRFEERLEVALAETSGSAALDDLEENGGAILDRLGEGLQQIALLVPVRQDPQLHDGLHGLVDLAYSVLEVFVISRGHAQELNTPRLHLRDATKDVIGSASDVLNSGSAVVF